MTECQDNLKMTIYTWYFTYGFKVKKQEWLDTFGYSMKAMPNEYRDQCENMEEFEEAYYEWLQMEEVYHGYIIQKKFEIDGEMYIARGFTHDTKYEDYVVIGIDLGELDHWEGDFKIFNVDCKQRIKKLLNDDQCKKLIQNNSEMNSTYYVLVDYELRVHPTVHISQNDCKCRRISS